MTAWASTAPGESTVCMGNFFLYKNTHILFLICLPPDAGQTHNSRKNYTYPQSKREGDCLDGDRAGH